MKKIYLIIITLIFSMLFSFNCFADSNDDIINIKSNNKANILLDLQEKNDYEICIIIRNIDTNKTFEIRRTYETRNNAIELNKGNYKIDSIKQYINNREKVIPYRIIDNININNNYFIKLTINNNYCPLAFIILSLITISLISYYFFATSSFEEIKKELKTKMAIIYLIKIVIILLLIIASLRFLLYYCAYIH